MAFCASCGAPVEGKFVPNGRPWVRPFRRRAAPGVAAAGMTDNAASSACAYVLGLITAFYFWY